MALAEFMSDGSFARFLRRMRRIYAERHALLSEGLLRIAPDLLRPIPSFSGLHLTTLLTENIEESEMRERALAADVGVYPLSRLGMSALTEGASVRIRQHSADADPRWSSAPHGSLR
jgi:GntR family transcriptional regulator/MocR family aminotransferase